MLTRPNRAKDAIKFAEVGFTRTVMTAVAAIASLAILRANLEVG